MDRAITKLNATEPAPSSLQYFLKTHEPPPTAQVGEGRFAKRRKIDKDGCSSRQHPSEIEDQYLTFAKLDLNIIFPQGFPSPLEPPANSERLPVRLVAFVEDAHRGVHHRQYIIKVATIKGIDLCQLTLNGFIEKRDQEIVQNAISLSRPSRTVRARSSFELSPRGIEVGTTAKESVTADNASLSLVLTVRILVPDVKSLLESPGLPRSLDLSQFFGAWPSNKRDPWSPKDFYDHVHVPDPKSGLDLPPLAELQCNLYPFQKRAIRWLLEREGAFPCDSPSEDSKIAHGFVRTQDQDGRDCFSSQLLGVATTDKTLVRSSCRALRGGILSEEMGLGKTVEIIALICLHRRQESQDQENNISSTKQLAGTLIITPPSILQQWKEELQALAPCLKVAIYQGMKIESHKNDDTEIKSKCITSDVVLTTYPILAREIHHAEAPTKNLRHEKRYEKRLSPLTQINWFRVVLDEAQMVESGVSNAAKVASLIPRQIAWCVSGTPARNAKDLLGLLIFLQYQPYCSLPLLWDRLVNQHREVLWSIFQNITLRHTKAQIRDEIQLPHQKRVVLTVPFTQIEEQHYSALFQQMAEECGLDQEGAPLREDWDPEDLQIIDRMRIWLVRLRQTCLHPEVGNRNRKALGSGKGPLRTVAEVLEVMIEQNDLATRTEERNVLMSQIKRGQIHEDTEETQEALEIWLSTLDEARNVVRECRLHLQFELDKVATERGAEESPKKNGDDVDVGSTGPHRQRLRAALEVEHMCTFFAANAYYQLKTKEVGASGEPGQENNSQETVGDTRMIGQVAEKPMSNHAKDLERQEESFYEAAKLLRRELLVESQMKADKAVSTVKDRCKNLVPIPCVKPPKDQGGIQIRAFFDRIERLVEILQSQTMQIIEWRNQAGMLLTLPLVDQEETELQGDEYETSTKQQDEVYVYVDALRALVSDRHVSVTGQDNTLIDHEMEVALKEAKEGRGHSPELLIRLLKKRSDLKTTSTVGTVRGLMTQLRELRSELRPLVEQSNKRAAAETIFINSLIQHLHQISLESAKPLASLNKEVEIFKDTMNLRLDYYRQLQAISDTVAPFEETMSAETRADILTSKLEEERRMKARVATLRSNGRYLVYLRGEAADTSQRTCIICTSPFESGILTSCGHTYCSDCLRLWWSRNRSCPQCKKHLSRNDFHQITFKSKELTMQEEEAPSVEPSASTLSATGSETIYAGVRESTLNQIRDIDLDGSFGTKIDTLARHLLWIREHDPGAKSIIFSQYRDFLDVLSRAFSHFKINFTGIDRKDGIRKFKSDPNVECFFLHAKAHSSGLNLVNATHVFLCEPLINTAIELQAIARVHRIGQHNETTVWMYLVEGTVEKSIYDISVQRRLAHIGQLQAQSRGLEDQEPAESQLEMANTVELEQNPLSHLLTKGGSGGELVKKGDLWSCLFSHAPGQSARPSDEAQLAIAHHLGADAAERRGRENGDQVM